jgi:Na+-driven multidrug efflux pump
MIFFQSLLGLLLTVIFLGGADKLAAAFVPIDVRQTSLNHVRISSVLSLSSALEIAVSCAARALDYPDVPLLISSTKFVINIVLDMLIISRLHVGSHSPTVNMQGVLRMTCDMIAAVCGLVCFVLLAFRMQRHTGIESDQRPQLSFRSWQILACAGIYMFLESALRNAIYLGLIAGIVSMGFDYATAWGVFNTIRWGIIMVPVQALEASTLTFVGHARGHWRATAGPEFKRTKISKEDLLCEFVVVPLTQ